MKFKKLAEGIYPFNAGAKKGDIYGFSVKRKVIPKKPEDEADEDAEDEASDEETESDEIVKKTAAVKKLNQPMKKLKEVNKKKSYSDTYEGKVFEQLSSILCDMNRLDYLKDELEYFGESISTAADLLELDKTQTLIEKFEKKHVDPIKTAQKIYRNYMSKKWQNIQVP